MLQLDIIEGVVMDIWLHKDAGKLYEMWLLCKPNENNLNTDFMNLNRKDFAKIVIERQGTKYKVWQWSNTKTIRDKITTIEEAKQIAEQYNLT